MSFIWNIHRLQKGSSGAGGSLSRERRRGNNETEGLNVAGNGRAEGRKETVSGGITNTKDLFKKSCGNSLAIEASGNIHAYIK